MLREFFALSLSAAAASAQVEVYVLNDSNPGDAFGSALCLVGDVVADGHDDLAIGVEHGDAETSGGGQVVVIFGRTRHVIRIWNGAVTFDFNARIQSGVDPQLVAGEEVFTQKCSRDPAEASTTNLTDALAFFVTL